MNDVKIIGARYNRGTNPSLESIKKDTRYGDFIIRNWQHFNILLWRQDYNRMKKFIRIIFILFYLLCMIVIYLSTVDKYGVVYDMDPTLPQGSLSNSSDNGKVFAGLILLIIFISQIAFFYFERSRKWKWATGIMTALAFLFVFIM